MVADVLYDNAQEVVLHDEVQEKVPIQVCSVCGTRIVTGEGGLQLCVQHLFERVIFPEDVESGERLTRKKSVGETLL